MSPCRHEIYLLLKLDHSPLQFKEGIPSCKGSCEALFRVFLQRVLGVVFVCMCCKKFERGVMFAEKKKRMLVKMRVSVMHTFFDGSSKPYIQCRQCCSQWSI